MTKALPFAVLALLAVPASAAEVHITAQNPVVELTVCEVVQAAPDMATIGAGVTTRAASASEAMRQNAPAMERVIARLIALGIARKDIQTSNFSLNPVYDHDRSGKAPQLAGYDASNQVVVTLRDLDRVGATLDALVAVGATNLHGPHFVLERDEQVRGEARRGAYEQGRLRASEYAALAGYSGVRLLNVSEDSPVVRQRTGAVRAMSIAQDESTPVEPGQVGVGVQLTVTYEMTR